MYIHIYMCIYIHMHIYAFIYTYIWCKAGRHRRDSGRLLRCGSSCHHMAAPAVTGATLLRNGLDNGTLTG